MSVQLLDPLLPQNGMLSELSEGGTAANGLGGGMGNALAFNGLDNISSQYPQQNSLGDLGSLVNDMNPMQSPASMMLGPLGGLTQFLSQMISQFFGNNGSSNGLTSSGLASDEQYFNSASGGSVGDPHLSFNGTTWNNMGSQPDLLNSDSFHGGYQLSTQTTAPSANGVTYNQSATVATNFGGTQVTLDNAGNATITQNGYSYPMAPGTQYNLGHGENVARNQDGSLAITCSNRNGGTITTTMRDNGQGVDVNTSANNVNLGGVLVNGADGSQPLEPMGPQPPHYIRYNG
jgi:hypothetical protein